MRTLRFIARLNVGGPARHAVILDEGLRARGHETLLVHGTPAEDEGSMDDLVVERRLPSATIASLGRRVRPWSDLTALAAAIRIVFRHQPDVVHTHTAKAGTIGRAAALVYNCTRRRARRCAVVHTFHGHVFNGYFGPLASGAVRSIERTLAMATDTLVTISPAQRNDIVERYAIAPAAKIAVVPLGLELSRLARAAGFREAIGLGRSDFVIGYVGRLVPIKNLSVLIEAFREVVAARPHARLVLVGDGELRTTLEQQVRQAGLDAFVRFCGWRRDLGAVYGGFDAVALSSRNEGTPVMLIEAMSMGLPVVATAVGGVPDVVQDQTTGLLVGADRPSDLAKALIRLIDDSGLRSRLGRAAQASVCSRYASDRLVDEIEGVYAAALERRRGKR